jgi:hypothetical protein
MPVPMNNVAKRFGYDGISFRFRVSPQTGTDSSHGSEIATPAPRRNVRRESEVEEKPESLIGLNQIGASACLKIADL